jgi:hypothetical protein
VRDSCRDTTGYTAHVSVRTDQRGTAILTRDSISTERPSGRSTEAKYRYTLFVNTSAPAVSSREPFFNTDVIYLLRHSPQYYILSCDFKCVLCWAQCSTDCSVCVTHWIVLGRRNFNRYARSDSRMFGLASYLRLSWPRSAQLVLSHCRSKPINPTPRHFNTRCRPVLLLCWLND